MLVPILIVLYHLLDCTVKRLTAFTASLNTMESNSGSFLLPVCVTVPASEPESEERKTDSEHFNKNVHASPTRPVDMYQPTAIRCQKLSAGDVLLP